MHQEHGRYLILVGHSYGGLIIKQACANPESIPAMLTVLGPRPCQSG